MNSTNERFEAQTAEILSVDLGQCDGGKRFLSLTIRSGGDITTFAITPENAHRVASDLQRILLATNFAPDHFLDEWNNSPSIDDLDIVFKAHRKDSKQLQDWFAKVNRDRVLSVMSWCGNVDDQAEGLLSELEDQMIEFGTISGPKKFHVKIKP